MNRNVSEQSAVKNAEGHMAVRRTMNLLEYLCCIDEPVSASKIIDQMGINKKTIYSMLDTMTTMGYIQKNERGLISVTDKLYRLSSDYPYSTPLLQATKLNIQGLKKKYHLHIMLTSVSEDMQTTTLFRTSIDVMPKDFPWYTTARGKLLAAYMSDEQFDELCRNTTLTPYTANTITTIDQLYEERRLIQSRKYSLDQGEFLENVVCSAFPIFDASKRLVGILSCSDEKSYMSTVLESLIQDGLSCSRRISLELGWA